MREIFHHASRFFVKAAITAAFAFGSNAGAQDLLPIHFDLPKDAHPDERDFALSYVATTPPEYLNFCAATPQYCAGDTKPVSTPRVIRLNQKNAVVINTVNLYWNNKIISRADSAQYGREDHWTFPANDHGDCEDYVIAKRDDLIKKGFPREALLITLVRTTRPEDHAVLSVRTDKGTFVLDNLTNDIRLWSRTSHAYNMVQNPYQPSVWSHFAIKTHGLVLTQSMPQ